jgi:hypothetical protein
MLLHPMNCTNMSAKIAEDGASIANPSSSLSQ